MLLGLLEDAHGAVSDPPKVVHLWRIDTDAKTLLESLSNIIQD